jgi:hypothetical protein
VANAVAGDRAALLALVELSRNAPQDQPAGQYASWSRVEAMMVLELVLQAPTADRGACL